MAPRGTPQPRLRHSLAARISALVLLVVLATGTSAVVVLGQLRALQASFDLSTEVYVEFNHKLAAAHVQAIRIGEQVRTFHERGRTAPEAPPPIEGKALRNLQEALDVRARFVREARGPIDAALRQPERFGGGERLDGLRGIDRQLEELEGLVALDNIVDPVDVLRDDRSQAQIERRFQTLAERSRAGIEELRAQGREAQRRTERLTIGLTFGVVVVGLVAVVAVFFTLRPLRRLALGVRRLGGGDWTQRIDLPSSGRDDEVARLAREFNLMADALQEREQRLLRGERLAAAGQLAAQITHEIRNPLSSVALNAELLEDELEDATPETRRLLERISAEVDRLTAVTEDYLSFARHPKPELAPLELTSELVDLLEFLDGELSQAGIEVVRQLPGGEVWIMGDGNQLRRAFMNLLRNAQEAVLDEGAAGRRPQIRVTVDCKEAAGSSVSTTEYVTVSVEDNGPGIHTEDGRVDRVFEAFYTSKARGTGLGLPIVQQIVQDHGGTVRVAKTDLSGTCFRVELPACAPPAGSVISHTAKLGMDRADPPGRANTSNP